MADPLKKKQYVHPRPVFDAFDQDAPRRAALGDQYIKAIMTAGGIQSSDYIPGVSGWTLLPRGGLKFGATTGVFPPGSITFTDIQDISTARLLGRSTAGTGSIEQITIGSGLQLSGGSLSSTITQYTDEMAQDAVGAMVDTTLEYVDATPLLRRAALTGDVTASAGSNTTTIANDAVTNAKAANMAQSTIKGRAAAAGTGDPTDLTAAQVKTILGIASTDISDFDTAAKAAIGTYKNDTVSLAAQAADVADTNFANASTAGLYRISYYIVDTTADLTAGAVQLNIKFTDNAAARTVSATPVPLTATTGFGQGTIIARLASGNVKYGVTHTGIFGTADYALYLTCERIA